jgi:peptidoglycan-associated lipoprotein
VTIEGHCDERGTPEYNIALGERRAKAVVQYLQNLGVSGAQLSTVSYGEEKPLIRASSNEAYAKNRRGVIVY